MSDPFVYVGQGPPPPPAVVYHNSPYLAPFTTQLYSPFIPNLNLGTSPYIQNTGLPPASPHPGTSPLPRSPFIPDDRVFDDSDEAEEDKHPVHPFATKRRLSYAADGAVPFPHTNPFLPQDAYLQPRRPRRQRTRSDTGYFDQTTPQIVNINNGYWISPHASPYGGHAQLPPSGPVVAPPVALHPYIDAALNRGDIAFNLAWPVFNPSIINRYHQQTPISAAEFDQIATHPPMFSMKIKCDLTPNWVVNIDYHKEHAAYGATPTPITVGAVLNAIWRAMQMRISQDLWASLDKRTEFSVSNAYTNRFKAVRGYMDERAVRNDGVKRVDFLGGRRWFKGVSRTAEGVDTFKLHVV
ncbi:hypothetical protein D9619_005786 [Psilocybe cf. subviscida]|uniref:DUF6699 domain-containing protein n=1 Tax=Psilocybe cf. subviscida TaxID=2480587 RepID=A0A8H5FBB3_9AGAR|nr:hypothetical protein D9619_005786 [Psilocybe cf. subviscida]